MDLPDLKALKKLADACRKAGIRSYKGGGFEFTLDDTLPPPRPKKLNLGHPGASSEVSEVESDGFEGLSEMDRLFWSSEPASEEG